MAATAIGCTSAKRVEMAELRRWVAGKLGDIGHESRVACIAGRLFDLTEPIHELPGGFRRLLRIGAMLHDCGRAGGAGEHHARGARMIKGARELPLTPFERKAAAFLARYHRGPLPRWALRPASAGDSRWRQRMRILLGLLRAADALDSRSVEPPTLVMRLKNRRLRINCYSREGREATRRAFDRWKKYRLLEKTLDVRVRLRIRQSDAALA